MLFLSRQSLLLQVDSNKILCSYFIWKNVSLVNFKCSHLPFTSVRDFLLSTFQTEEIDDVIETTTLNEAKLNQTTIIIAVVISATLVLVAALILIVVVSKKKSGESIRVMCDDILLRILLQSNRQLVRLAIIYRLFETCMLKQFRFIINFMRACLELIWKF